MSHKTVFMGIPAEKLGGVFDPGKVSLLVDEVMKNYVEGTAEEDAVKCDGYEIGGRWAGIFVAVKGNGNVLVSGGNSIPYDFDNNYHVIINNGKRGPYFIGSTEYVPINGGLKKDIAWDAVSKLREYFIFKMQERFLQGDPMLAFLSKQLEIINGDLYGKAAGQSVLMLKKGETFYEKAARENKKFGTELIPPDAYIDKNGVWHDENDIWAAFEKKLMSGNFDEMPEDLDTDAQREFEAGFEKFVTELNDDDCLVVLDCHSFP